MRTLMMFIVTVLSASVHAANYDSDAVKDSAPNVGIEKGYSAREAVDFAEALRMVRPNPSCTQVIPNANPYTNPYTPYPPYKNDSSNVDRNPNANNIKKIAAVTVYTTISSARFVKENEGTLFFARCVYTKRDLAPAIGDIRNVVCVTLSQKGDALKSVVYLTQKGVRKNIGTLKNPEFANVWEPVATYNCN